MSKGKILVVDDEAYISHVLRICLEMRGYQVIEAHEGWEAMLMAQAEKPGLIITDDLMPNVDGYDLAHQLHADTALQVIPVIMMAQLDSVAHRQMAKNAGVKHFMKKPLSLRLLLEQVDELLPEKVG